MFSEESKVLAKEELQRRSIDPERVLKKIDSKTEIERSRKSNILPALFMVIGASTAGKAFGSVFSGAVGAALGVTILGYLGWLLGLKARSITKSYSTFYRVLANSLLLAIWFFIGAAALGITD